MSCPFHAKASNEDGPPAVAVVAAAPEPVVSKPSSGGRCPFHSADSAASSARTQPIDSPVTKATNDSLSQSEALAASLVARDGVTAESTNALKSHFLNAYNEVADVAEAVNTSAEQAAENFRVSAVLAEKLGYSKEQLATIGADAWKMQGTGNPHTLAALKAGEDVIDLGSGFGLDAVLASAAVSESGHVIGIDLAEGEVFAAVRQVARRRLRNVDFRIGDIEELPIPSVSQDCAISNGGFCLVPDKRKAFREIFRVLRPGGRFSVSCTARKGELDMAVKWPTCMLVFIPLDEARDIVREAGFVDVDIYEDPEDAWSKDAKRSVHDAEGVDGSNSAEEVARGARVTVHRGDSAYSHLKGMDMNKLFVRVNIFGRKPAN